MEEMRAANFGPRKPGEIPRTFWLPDSEVQDETLCMVCRRLDVRAIVTQPSYPLEYASLGFYTDIRKRATHCRFCRLVVVAITTGWKPVMDLDWDNCSNLEKTECALNRKLRILTAPLPPEALDAKLRSGLIERTQLDLLGDDAVAAGMDKKALFHPRLVSADVADINMLKEWLHICKEHHGDTCGKEIASNSRRVPNTLRVIDVQDMRLVPASSRSWLSSTIRRYVALSYVWGNIGSVDLYKTTKGNFAQRKKRGGLASVPFPRSIRDAIETTRRLGERYIWIDAVCIIQDCKKDQKAQIGSMHIVYGAASFTIVAAGGDDAECLLPRSHNGSPHPIIQNVATVNGFQVAHAMPDLWDIERTPAFSPKWFTRGWTYQERHLSVRQFLFTTHQTYFQCRVACHSEGRLTERYASDTYSETSDPSTWGNKVVMEEGLRDPYFYRDSYRPMVQEYSARNLGFDSDALNAFMGVANVLEDQYGPPYKLHYGLPGPDFEEALTWQPAKPEPLIRRPDFPSWSWAGWRGAVRYTLPSAGSWMLLDDSSRATTHPIPEYILYTEGGSTVKLSRPPWMRKDFEDGARDVSYGMGELKPYSPLPPLRMDSPYVKLPDPEGAVPPGTLEFLAVVAPEDSFALVYGDEHFDGCNCFDSWPNPPQIAKLMWRIVDREGKTCGMLGNGVDFAIPTSSEDSTSIQTGKDNVEKKKRKMAFICIARSGSSGFSVTCSGYDQSKYVRADGCCFEVLLVEYGVHHHERIAERVAAGRIHEDAWAQADGLRWEKVFLR